MKLLFSEAKEILDFAQELQKENSRNYNTSIEQATLTHMIVEKSKKLVNDLGLGDDEDKEVRKMEAEEMRKEQNAQSDEPEIDWSGIYRDSENIDEYIEKVKESGGDEETAREMFSELNYKYQS